MKLMNRAKNIAKLENIQPVWYVSILYEIRRIQSSFFVMVDRLKEYRAFLPQEILAELDNRKDEKGRKNRNRSKKNSTGNEFDAENEGCKTQCESQSPRSMSNDKDDKKSLGGRSNQEKKGLTRKDSNDSLFSTEKSNSKPGVQKLDALAIGLEVIEGYFYLFLFFFKNIGTIIITNISIGYTMVSVTWNNYQEAVQVMGTEAYIKIHSHILAIVQECAKKGLI